MVAKMAQLRGTGKKNHHTARYATSILKRVADIHAASVETGHCVASFLHGRGAVAKYCCPPAGTIRLSISKSLLGFVHLRQRQCCFDQYA